MALHIKTTLNIQVLSAEHKALAFFSNFYTNLPAYSIYAPSS